MSVRLSKGGNVSLTDAVPNLTTVTVALGWQVRASNGSDYDLDASALALGPDGKVISDAWFVFFNNLTTPDGSVEHLGDNLVGGWGGDDEQINVDLTTVPTEVAAIVFAVSIYEADTRRQSFGHVVNAFIRVLDRVGDIELARFDLTEDASAETAVAFGELYRSDLEWRFRAIGQGYASGLRGIALEYGVHLS